MRPLPPQALHLPFEAGPYRMAMDLVTVPEAAWFELDQAYASDMTERRRLLDTAHHLTFAASPASDVARTQALALIAAALTAHHPDWFSQRGELLHNHLTTEAWNIKNPPLDPLELAGRLVQEDLCLIQTSNVPTGETPISAAQIAHAQANDVQTGNEHPIFTAAVLCFPSRWRLLDKIGKPLAAVHGPVPLYADRLARPVDRFMRHLKSGPIVSRLNWSVLDDPALFQPDGKWRVDASADITATNAGSRLFLRVERQTLRRLPHSDTVLFGIRVHVYPLTRVIDQQPTCAAALAHAVRALPDDILRYKSVLPFRDALLDWLDRC